MRHARRLQRLLERMGRIERMERGTICRMAGRPQYNHQTWRDGSSPKCGVNSFEVIHG